MRGSTSSAQQRQTQAAIATDITDETFQFLYKPHTITGMLVGGALLVYFAFTRDASNQPSNVKSGLLAICLVFLLFSMLQMRDSLFRRPHPAFWRIVMGAAVLYLCALVFLLFQSVGDARSLLWYIDPKLNVTLPERNYAEHCELYTPDDPTSNFKNLWDTLNDEFFAAHFIGWFVKAILLRDSTLCWVISVLFEIWELTFEYMLPNFKECWWDHIILDIIVCNGLGIFIGMLTCRYLEMKEYDWAGMWKLPNSKGKIWYKIVQQFTPFSYDEYNWDILKEYKRFLSVCMPGIREYYQFATDPTNKKFGTMAWLCCAIAGMEVLICVKFSRGHFPNPAPPEVVYSWAAFLIVFVVGSLIFFNRKNPRAKQH